MSHSQGYGKIYDELRGYFPPEYDLTPEELEKEIELENKKREIALGMMRTRFTDERAEAERIMAAEKERESVKAAPAPKSPQEEPAPAQKPEPAPNSAYLPTGEISIVFDEPIIPPADDSDELPEIIDNAEDPEAIVIPEADDVSNNELLRHYEPLNDLFDEMEDQTPEKEDGDSSMRKTVNWFFDFLEVFSICIACIIVVFALCFRLTKVSGQSMENTLFENEYLVVSDLFYEPCVGDIVVVQNTALQNEKLREPLVKRIIAVGGQSVDVSANGIVTITYEDGTSKVLDQPFIKDEAYMDVSGHYDVPEGYVFVMGDNRNHSTDSRSPLVGLIDERCIFGKAYVRVLPFTSFTVFENPYEK